MKERRFFLFFCMIFVGQSAFCQQKIMWQVKKRHAIAFSGGTLGYPAAEEMPVKNQLPGSFVIVQPDYYTKNFGFFCKKEWELEKSVNVPLKIRLGSVQYCDWMEGKTQHR